MLARSSGQQFQVESPAFKRLKAIPWAEEAEVGSIGVTWAENFYFARELNHGKLPLWDPYTGGGVPILDNGQSRPFNPFRLPFYLYPTSWMYSLTLFVGLVFGGVGAYLWLSRRGFSPAALTLGTGLFVLNPWVLDRLVLTDSGAYFVLPWCLLSLEKAVWRSWPSIARAALCFVIMGHSGHPVVFMIMACVAFAVYLFSQIRPGNNLESFSNRAKIMVVSTALTSICLAVLWLPLLKLLFLGYIYKKYAWFDYEYSWKSLTVLPSDMFMPPAVAAVLSCSLLAWKRLPKVWVTLLVAIFLVLFPLPWVGTRPSRLLSYLGVPSMYLKGVFWASLSFLTPYGLDAYRALRKAETMVAFSVGAAMLAVTGWHFVSLPMARNDISVFPATAFLLLALGLLAFVGLRTARQSLSALLMSAIALAPLAFPLSLNRLMWNTVDFKTNPVVEWLRANQSHARTASVDFRLSFAIPPNLGQAYGVRCVEVIAVIFLNNYWSMFHPPRPFPTAVFFDSLSTNVLSQMGASVVLLPNDAFSSGLDLLIKGTLFSAYSIPGAHGRLYFAERACHYKPSTTLASQILSLSQGTDAVAVVEAMGNPVPAVIPEISHGNGKAVFERDDTDHVIVCTECPSEGLLVLRDSWYPGWTAFIDGERTPILRINGCFRGVVVPAGKHKTKFVYRPILVYVAGVVSLLALLLVMLSSARKSSTDGSRHQKWNDSCQGIPKELNRLKKFFTGPSE